MKLSDVFGYSLRERFRVGIAVMVIPLIVLGVVGVVYLRDALTAFQVAAGKATTEMGPVIELQTLLPLAVMAPNDYLLSGDGFERTSFELLSKDIDGAFARALKVDHQDALERRLLRSARAEWREVKRQAAAIYASEDPLHDQAARESSEMLDAHADKAMRDLGLVHQTAQGEVAEAVSTGRSSADAVSLFTTGALGLSLIIAAFLSVLFSSSVIVPLRRFGTAARRLSEGDMAHRLDATGGDEFGQLATIFNEMAAKLEENQASLEYLSNHDSLTGLYNRREFRHRLREEMERTHRYGSKFSLLMLDIDHFKAINDTRGHTAGDVALRAFAESLREAVRPVDVVARYGGEEFAVILPETTCEKAISTAERIRKVVAATPIETGVGEAIRMTVSVGVTAFPGEGSDEDALVEADQALYTAKRGGRNRVVCLRCGHGFEPIQIEAREHHPQE